MTIACHNCHRDNPAGRGFCQYCGSRLVPPSPEPDIADRDEVQRLLEALRESKHAINSMQQDLDTATRELDEARDELKVLREKAITDTVNDAEERMAEQGRLRDRLAESQKSVETLQSELKAARSQFGSVQEQLKEEVAASHAKIASLALDLETAREKVAAEFHGKVAASEKLVDALKQDHASEIRKVADDHQGKIAALTHDLATAREKIGAEFHGRLVAGEKLIETLRQRHASEIGKVADGHQEKIAQKEALIEELTAKLQGLAGGGNASVPPVLPVTTTRRSFGTMAMAALATVSTGVGGAGGYFLLPGNDSAPDDLRAKLAEANKLNREMQEALRSQHEAYERINSDLKRAESQIKNQSSPNPGTDANEELQRQLTEARAATQQQQSRQAALQAEFDRSKQDIAARDQTIEQLNKQLRDAKAPDTRAQDPKPQDARPQEKDVRPKPRGHSIDLETTIRNFEREYGIPRIGR
ncbi:zinc ribbon domain-containing protein [Bradyrhizobium sp. cf659]|uniref:zinc ribbon domain-containing protein n=1 Tax=Bradyrhizobium sp. cf659 TaxID=1761771 RepID=UPI0008E6A109|nr:hypothetical protein [Bradyrhizobium sp. cf659]SFH98932.1 hypothetical protein SAMN04487925_1011425 [Bradyrhizobium sp. cf659]